jgi:hypothetical protein
VFELNQTTLWVFTLYENERNLLRIWFGGRRKTTGQTLTTEIKNIHKFVAFAYSTVFDGGHLL